MDLHAWITQQVDARETLARDAEADLWEVAQGDRGAAATTLRRCEADRRILARHNVDPARQHDPVDATACKGCGTECDVDWIDVGVLSDPEPCVVQGASRCTNPRCPNRFSQTADRAPTPEQLARRGDEALQRIRDIAIEPASPAGPTGWITTTDEVEPLPGWLVLLAAAIVAAIPVGWILSAASS